MTITARHSTPAPPPPVRDPLIRGPVWLETVLALALAVPTIGGGLWVINGWVYLADGAPAGIYAAAFAVCLFAILGAAVLGMAAGVIIASWLTTGWDVIRDVFDRARARLDDGSSTILFVLTVAVGLAMVVVIVGLLVALFGSLADAGWAP